MGLIPCHSGPHVMPIFLVISGLPHAQKSTSSQTLPLFFDSVLSREPADPP